MFFLRHNAVTPMRLDPAALGLESSTLPLSHCAPDRRKEGRSKSVKLQIRYNSGKYAMSTKNQMCWLICFSFQHEGPANNGTPSSLFKIQGRFKNPLSYLSRLSIIIINFVEHHSRPRVNCKIQCWFEIT